MTSGKRAKAQRRVLQTTTPRDPAAPNPITRDRARREHPLGPHAGAYVEWEDRMKTGLLRIMEENRRALGACTQDTSCTSSVHYPSCLAAQ